tara:strand:- start:82 stop:3153 length:3072 start_codon:yes stop_codon:yes gene_type:complete
MADLTERLQFTVEEDPNVRQTYMWDGEQYNMKNNELWRSLESQEERERYLTDLMYLREATGDFEPVSEILTEEGKAILAPFPIPFVQEGAMIESARELRIKGWAAMKQALDTITDYYKEDPERLKELVRLGSPVAGGKPPPGSGELFMGLFDYLYSPIYGVAKGGFGEPVGGTARGIAKLSGAEDRTVAEVGRFFEDLGTAGAEVFTPTAWLRYMRGLLPAGAKLPAWMDTLAGKPTVSPTAPVAADMDEFLKRGEARPEVLREVDEFGFPLLKPKPSPTRYGTSGYTGDAPRGAKPGTVEHLDTDVVGDIATDAGVIERVANARAAAGGDKERLYRTVSQELKRALEEGEIGSSSLVKLLEDLGIPPEEFFKQTVRDSAKILNIMSQTAKKLAKNKKLSDPLRRDLELMAKEIDSSGKVSNPKKFWNIWRKAENFRRGFLVTQLGTAVRNFVSQTGRLSIGMIDDAIQGAMVGSTAKQSLKNVWDSIMSDARQFRVFFGKDRKTLNALLDGQPLTKEMLLNKSVHEVEALNKITRFLNTANIFQERLFRRMAFQARLSKRLKEKGYNYHTMDHKAIPPALIDDAIEHALDISFAATGKGYGKTIVNAFEDLPWLYQINPFPRFAFANALPFLAEHSPWGLAKALGPRAIADLASGNPRRFARAASRGIIGTSLLAWAMEIRNGPNAGERWYEYKWGPPDEYGVRQTVGLRYYAPLTTYLFIAEALKGDKANLTRGDWTEAVSGINRISGTGLILLDYLKSKYEKVDEKILQKYIGSLLGSLTVPAKQVADFYDAYTGDQTVRSTRADVENLEGETIYDQYLAQTRQNLPGYRQKLPLYKTPLREGDVSAGEPVNLFGIEIPPTAAKQLLGMNKIRKTLVEQEVDRLQIDYGYYMPRTGRQDANTLVASYMAPDVVSIIPMVMNSDLPIGTYLELEYDRSGRLKTNERALIQLVDGNVPYRELSDEGKAIALQELFSTIRKDAMERLKTSNVKHIKAINARIEFTDKYSQQERDYLKLLRGEK